MIPSTTVTRLQRKTRSVGESGNLLRRRLERRPAGVILLRVVAQQAHDGDVRPALEPLRDRLHEPLPAGRRDLVHERSPCRLQGRSPIEFRQRVRRKHRQG